MKTAKELYPDGYYEDYTPIIHAFGKVILRVDTPQPSEGDTWVLYGDLYHRRIGYLEFGWGSCSGCDALQGCANTNEVQDLMNQLYDNMKWFESPEEAFDYFKNHDWELDWTDRHGAKKWFVDMACRLLDWRITDGASGEGYDMISALTQKVDALEKELHHYRYPNRYGL